MSERSTHFQGFAKRLWQEINDKGKFNIDMEAPDTDEIVTRIIAQRAYDLVEHALLEVPPSLILYQTRPEMALAIKNIPDLNEWPFKPPVEPDETQP